MSDPEPATADPPVRRAFLRGVNTGLVVPATVLSVWMAFWTHYQVPIHEDVFKSVKVNMPVMTEVLLRVHPWPVFLFVALALACVLATALKGDRWPAAAINVATCVAGLFWLAFLSITLSGPLMSILRGISTR